MSVDVFPSCPATTVTVLSTSIAVDEDVAAADDEEDGAAAAPDEVEAADEANLFVRSSLFSWSFFLLNQS